MGEPQPPANVSVLPTISGAIYKPLHVERQVKIYPIQEHELTTLNMFSTAVTICASFSSGAFIYLLEIYWDLQTSTDPLVHKMGGKAIAVGSVVMLICLVIGGWALWSKNTELKKILRESRISGS